MFVMNDGALRAVKKLYIRLYAARDNRTIPQNRYDQISKLLSGSITASLSFYFPRSCITIFRTCLDSDIICSDSAIEALALDS
jgi:hypothetical protein